MTALQLTELLDTLKDKHGIKYDLIKHVAKQLTEFGPYYEHVLSELNNSLIEAKTKRDEEKKKIILDKFGLL